MSFDASRQPVIHGLHLDLGSLQGLEAPFDDEQPLVACGSVFDGDRVIVGDEHPFAVVLYGLLDGLAIYIGDLLIRSSTVNVYKIDSRYLYVNNRYYNMLDAMNDAKAVRAIAK